MGFIHQTNSDILGVETRHESVTLMDLSEGTQHLDLRPGTKKGVQNEVVWLIMQQAGEAFASSNLAKASKLKEVAEIVKNLKLTEAATPHAFEASNKWLKSLVEFVNGSDEIKRQLGIND